MIFMIARGPNTDLHGFRILRTALFSKVLALFPGVCSYEQALEEAAETRNLRLEVGNRDKISKAARARLERDSAQPVVVMDAE